MSTAPAGTNLAALLDRGDEFTRAGDPKAAMSFYQAALQAARSAAQTRERMASFQQGIRNARSAAPSDQDCPGAEDGREEDQ